MIFLGLDPGIALTGYGVLDSNKPELFVSCGCFATSAKQDLNDRLLEIGNNLSTLISNVNPDTAVVEQVYFGSNTTTAIQTAQVRGILIYLLRKNHIAVTSLTPLEIKSRLTGYGRASKQQIQAIVTSRLNLNSLPKPDDAADALAAALCLVDNKINIPTIARYNDETS